MESLSTVLYSLFRGTPRHEEWIVACLQGAWPGLLGERLSRVCRPAGCLRGTLGIEVVVPEWLEALEAMKSELEVRLREATSGEVREIRFRPS